MAYGPAFLQNRWRKRLTEKTGKPRFVRKPTVKTMCILGIGKDILPAETVLAEKQRG